MAAAVAANGMLFVVRRNLSSSFVRRKVGVQTFQPRQNASCTARNNSRCFTSFSRTTQQNQQHHSKSFSSPKNRDPGLAFTSVLSDPAEVPGPDGIPSRSQQVANLQNNTSNNEYDLLVIGGGATGAGVALDAAARGLKVACVERGDFSSETSSRSTKLIWAGIKYMGTATAGLLSVDNLTKPVQALSEFWDDMKMVWHCHTERRYMTRTQKHLCHWIPIAIPFYSWHVSPPPMGHSLYSFFPILAPLTLKFYDALSFFTCPPSYIMSKGRAQQVFPQLVQDNLKYCAVFYEAQHNDARTNLAIAMTAAEKGAHIANYVEMVDLHKDESTGKVVGARVQDRMTGKVWDIRAKKVVLAGGPFTDDLRRHEVGEDETVGTAVQGASGTHVVLPGHFVPKDMGLLDFNTSDGRFLFVLPWLNHTLIGTTDHEGPAETLHNAPEDEIEWILKESQKFLSSDPPLRRSDVLSAWRGWRPLAADPHAPPGAPVSRDHVISENPQTGVVFIAGGKWTTWREMAQDVVDRVVAEQHGEKGPICTTLEIPLHGGRGHSDNLTEQLIQKYGMEEHVAQHLVATYGGKVWEVCQHRQPATTSDNKTRPQRFDRLLVDGYPYLECEVLYACREYACTVEDVLSRRTRLAFLNKDAALEALPRVADIMARELSWSKKVKQNQMDAARNYVDSYGGRTPADDKASRSAVDDQRQVA